MDKKGHALLRERVERLEEALLVSGGRLACCMDGGGGLEIAACFVVTGVGSSEGHARFLVSLINRCSGKSARYEPLSFFYGEGFRGDAEATLIVFSQGLSSNAQIALQRRSAYGGCVLFTSCTQDGLKGRGSGARLELLQKLESEACVSIVRFPLEDEYTILIRVAGPLYGYLACMEWCEEVLGLALGRPCGDQWMEAVNQIREQSLIEGLVEDFIAGVDFNFSNRCTEYGQNLAFKRVEGIFGAQPVLRDLFQYSHGPFQQASLSRRAQWIFRSNRESEASLVGAVLPLFERTGGVVRVIDSLFPEPWAIVFYELLLNRVMLSAIEYLNIDQIKWPMKGEDGEAYLLSDCWESRKK